MNEARRSTREFRAGACGRRGARGFTLFEILAVVTIISILAALALPGGVERLRDNRANEAAQNISTFFRNARARALGRGAAQLVRFRSTVVPRGELLMYEAVQPQVVGPTVLGNCGFLPPTSSNSCVMNTWPVTTDNGAAPTQTSTSRFVESMSLATATYENVSATFMLSSGSTTVANVCFTPSGRTFFTGDATPLAPLNSVVRIDVRRTSGGAPVGITRQVLIPPNGATRLVL